jgi:hypothetical protein
MTQDHWHLRKEIPVALIFAIIVQTGGVLWWASAINQRVSQAEVRIEAAENRSRNVDNLIARQATDIAVLVERIDTQNRRIEETNDLLRQYLRLNGAAP